MDDEAKLAHAVGDRTRLNILKLLSQLGPLSTSELAEKLNKHKSTIIRHLSILQDAGLVTKSNKLSYTYVITNKGINFLKLASERTGVKIELPIKKRHKIFLKRSFIKTLFHLPAIIFIAIGFIGMLAPVQVSILSRLLWLIIFIFISILWELFVKRILNI